VIHPTPEETEARKARFRSSVEQLKAELLSIADRVDDAAATFDGPMDRTVRSLLADLDKAHEQGTSGAFRIADPAKECVCEGNA
jgi:hypothetical protein